MTNSIKLKFTKWHTGDKSKIGIDAANELHLHDAYVKMFSDREINDYKLIRVSERNTFVPRFIAAGDEITFEDVRAGNMISDKHYSVHIVFGDDEDVTQAQFIISKDIIA